MRIFVDIDNTICHAEDDSDYSKAEPIMSRINRINMLYEHGHKIVYWTARGTSSGILWFTITQTQLLKWGCKFHELRMGKPEYDLFIDDKNMLSDIFFADGLNTCKKTKNLLSKHADFHIK
jgi:hypothetical protein